VAQVDLGPGGWQEIRALVRGFVDPIESERDEMGARPDVAQDLHAHQGPLGSTPSDLPASISKAVA